MSVLNGIEEAEYKAWRHHPVTRLVLQYLEDYRAALVKEAVGRWESGKLVLTDEHELRGRILVVREIGELPFSAIEEFYRTGDDNEVSEQS